MDWDFETFEETTPAAAEPRTYEEVPEGTHTFTLKGGAEKPDRTEIRLAHDDRRYGLVFCKLIRGQTFARKLATQLRAALAMSPAEWAEATPESMKGRKVRARIYHQVKGDRMFVNVGDFLPLEEPAEADKPAAKPAAARGRMAGPEDDIPF